MKKLWISITSAIVVLAVAAPCVRAYVTAKQLSAAGSIVQKKWRPGAFPIPWQLNPTQAANVTGSRSQAEVVRSSFSAWQSLPTASVTLTEGATTPTTAKPAFDGMNIVTTNISAAEYSSSALGLTLVYSFDTGGADLVDSFGRPVEFAGQIAEADIMFNPATPFSTDITTPSNKLDFQSVATHEIGHLLGLDHSTLVSATMFPSTGNGFSYARVPSSDDIAAVSTIYPSGVFATKGKISGTVRTTSGTALFGAVVVAVNSSGTPVAGTITDPSGTYAVEGLDAGAYTVYAEPMDGPFTVSNVQTLGRIYPSSTTSSNFTTRYH